MAAKPSASEARRKKPDRMPENAVNGTGRGQLAAEMLPMHRGSSVGMAYDFPNPRGESAGYTTSSPGWGHPMAQPPASLMPAAPAAPAVAPVRGGGGGGDRGPQTTGAIPIPSPRPEGQGMAVGGAGAFIPPAIPPSMLSPLGTLTGVPPGLVNPNEGTLGTNMPPALAGVPPALDMPPVNNPALRGVPPDLQGAPPAQPPAAPPGPFLPRPAPQIGPNVGDIAAMPEGARRPAFGKKTPLAKKGGRVGKSQYRVG